MEQQKLAGVVTSPASFLNKLHQIIPKEDLNSFIVKLGRAKQQAVKQQQQQQQVRFFLIHEDNNSAVVEGWRCCHGVEIGRLGEGPFRLDAPSGS